MNTVLASCEMYDRTDPHSMLCVRARLYAFGVDLLKSYCGQVDSLSAFCASSNKNLHKLMCVCVCDDRSCALCYIFNLSFGLN